MTDPLSLGVIGGVALTEGIKFLYGQAVELIKMRRERKDELASKATVPQDIDLPTIAFQGNLRGTAQDMTVVERMEDDIKRLAAILGPYATGLEEVRADDGHLLDSLDALRKTFEAVYGQRITFVGESGSPSGTPIVVGEAEVDYVQGKVAAVRARHMGTGDVRGTAKAHRVEPTGTLYGVEIDRVD